MKGLKLPFYRQFSPFGHPPYIFSEPPPPNIAPMTGGVNTKETNEGKLYLHVKKITKQRYTLFYKRNPYIIHEKSPSLSVDNPFIWISPSHFYKNNLSPSSMIFQKSQSPYE